VVSYFNAGRGGGDPLGYKVESYSSAGWEVVMVAKVVSYFSAGWEGVLFFVIINYGS